MIRGPAKWGHLSLTRQDRSKLNRRIEQLETESARFKLEQEAMKLEVEAAKKIESDVLDARTSVTLAKFGTGFSGDDVRVAEKLLSDLQASKDSEAYRKMRDVWESEVKTRRNATAAQLEQEAKKQRDLAALIRRGEADETKKPSKEKEEAFRRAKTELCEGEAGPTGPQGENAGQGE